MATIGEQLEARYKQLGLTQDSLALLAGVSNSTIRNVLRDRVGTARTWPRVERALGWMPGSVKRLRKGESPEEIMPMAALKSLYAATLRLADKKDPRTQIVLSFLDQIDMNFPLVEGGWANEDTARASINKLWPIVSSQLSPDEVKPLIEGLRDFGWRPDFEIGGAAGSITRAVQLKESQSRRPLSVLPRDVALLLDEGALVTYELHRVPSNNKVATITLVISEGDTQPPSSDLSVCMSAMAAVAEKFDQAERAQRRVTRRTRPILKTFPDLSDPLKEMGRENIEKEIALLTRRFSHEYLIDQGWPTDPDGEPKDEEICVELEAIAELWTDLEDVCDELISRIRKAQRWWIREGLRLHDERLRDLFQEMYAHPRDADEGPYVEGPEPPLPGEPGYERGEN